MKSPSIFHSQIAYRGGKRTGVAVSEQNDGIRFRACDPASAVGAKRRHTTIGCARFRLSLLDEIVDINNRFVEPLRPAMHNDQKDSGNRDKQHGKGILWQEPARNLARMTKRLLDEPPG